MWQADYLLSPGRSRRRWIPPWGRSSSSGGLDADQGACHQEAGSCCHNENKSSGPADPEAP